MLRGGERSYFHTFECLDTRLPSVTVSGRGIQPNPAYIPTQAGPINAHPPGQLRPHQLGVVPGVAGGTPDGLQPAGGILAAAVHGQGLLQVRAGLRVELEGFLVRQGELVDHCQVHLGRRGGGGGVWGGELGREEVCEGN